MEKIDFLGEDDFLEIMQTENLRWREEAVSQGEFSSFDGTRLNYYSAMPDYPKAVVVFVHGFCEFFGKYHEYT